MDIAIREEKLSQCPMSRKFIFLPSGPFLKFSGFHSTKNARRPEESAFCEFTLKVTVIYRRQS